MNRFCCDNCGHPFAALPATRRGEKAYCSRACRDKASAKKRLKTKCATCATPITVPPCRQTNSAGQELANHYCDRACWSNRAKEIKMNEKTTVGGARENAGRKPKRTDGATMGLRLSADVREFIKARAHAAGQSPADYVEAKFRAEMKN